MTKSLPDDALEQELRNRGCRFVAGVDEAGRGPLAGPVFAAAVILPASVQIPGLNDSKKLTDRKRRELFCIIKERCVDFAVCSCDEKTIDEINILNATFLAMNQALSRLDRVDFALIDGNMTRNIPVPAKAIVKGDQKCVSIAAASILAKVSRDVYMEKMAALYPEYGFEKHKGYGTGDHIAILRELGPCAIHRASFLHKVLQENAR